MKQIQLAHLYKNGGFYGYGIAVDGQLLTNQVAVSIETKPNQPPRIYVDFYLDSEAVNNPIDIELGKKKQGGGR
ncbi:MULTISPECIES: hypothetical protein [unclassified Gilliamella]|uniref:hypothetical protein n=1 Tax=unclassified Gilliamella TaxID=2685620 RepID=UPI001327DCFF|nr:MULTISPECIES: hypothetical protein [unclassified Gilliamella]MWN32104.1 hypothetical protein [Gilliamella sp. Pra-s60]MWP29363.1 hypothetical protein [Gilliamella sp. Pra-s54]